MEAKLKIVSAEVTGIQLGTDVSRRGTTAYS
jgi:hypothetical protein